MSANNTMAASFIGKDVTYNGNSLQIKSGATVPSIIFDSGSTAQNAVVSITNAQGKVVRTIQVPAVTSGENTVTWDGKGTDGAVLPDGKYTFSVAATDASGNNLAFQEIQTGHVNGIVFKNGQTLVDIDGNEISVSDIIGIHETSTTQTT